MAALRYLIFLSLIVGSLSFSLTSLIGLAGRASSCVGQPSSVPALNVQQYLGRWYQMYSDFVVNNTFERGAKCVTADYGLTADDTISVYNANTKYTPDGELMSITGVASVPNPDKPGQLSVSFPGIPVPGEYWVIMLGPVVADEYQYAVVTDSRKVTLFVLARDPDGFRADYKTEVLEFVDAAGFACFWNRPQETYQAGDCQYAPTQ